MIRLFAIFVLLWFSLPLSSASAVEFDHGDWDALLKRHVISLHEGQASEVDYAGFALDHEQLKAYLNRLSAVSTSTFDQWPKNDQLAFLINAYNAWTVELILTAWPDLSSIKDLGSIFSSPWGKSFIPLLGETRSLDDIEHGLIRGSGRYNDPRIHFAVNCASIGCPALRPKAYTGEKIDSQLESQAAGFLADRSRNRLNDGTLFVSPIFKWYREDFEHGWQGYHSLSEFFADHASALGLTPENLRDLSTGKVEIEFQDYDWKLNRKRT